jgi:hypothetical protein
MKLSLNITVMAILVVFAFWIRIPYFIDKPEDIQNISFHERLIRSSGLPPMVYLAFRALSFIVFACVLVLFLYIYTLDKSLTCENDVLRLRRYCSVYQYFLFAAGVISVARIFMAIFGLSTIQHINYAHIAHSWLMDGFVGLFICIWFFFLTRKYTKAIQTVPPSVILSAKHRGCQL